MAPSPPGKRLIRRAGKRGGKFPITVLKAGVEQIRADAERGLSLGSIANRLGVSRRVFLDIRKRQPEVVEALDIGHSQLEDEIVDLLLEQGRSGNTTSLIWLSKNRLGWRDQPEAPSVSVQINAPNAQLTTSEMRGRLDELLVKRQKLIAVPLLGADQGDD